MKSLAIAILSVLGLSACVAVPVDRPGVYVAPPAVVVQPYGYYHYYYGPRHPRHRW
jgi:hypothetical protein